MPDIKYLTIATFGMLDTLSHLGDKEAVAMKLASECAALSDAQSLLDCSDEALVEWRKYISPYCDILFRYMIQNFLREPHMLTLTTDQIKILRDETQCLVRTKIDDVVVNDISDEIFPVFIVRHAISGKLKLPLCGASSWSEFSKPYTRFIM